RRAALLPVDLHERDAARRAVDDDADVRLAGARALEAAAELTAVVRVHVVDGAHIERARSAVIALVAHVERQVLVAALVIATGAAATAAGPLALRRRLGHRDLDLKLRAVELVDAGDLLLGVVAAYRVDDE